MPKKNTASTVFLIDGLRTPIGHPYMGLRDLSAAKLAGLVTKRIIARNKIDKRAVTQVIFGNVVGAGTGQNLARQAAILGGLPVTTPALTVNSVCGAGLDAVILAAESIAAGHAQLVLAGGTESASQSPYFVSRVEAENYTDRKQELNTVDCLVHDGLLCAVTGQRMGELVEDLAHRYNISRETQDDYAFDSHRKACRAQRENRFKKEIISVKTAKKTVVKDEHPRKNLERSSLSRLPPVFWTGGTVTAGNSSLSCDGAAAVLVADSGFVAAHKIKPLGRVVGYVSVAVDPVKTFEASAEGIAACLKKCRMTIKDIDLFELGEAFAAQIIHAQKAMNIPAAKINVWGGDIAFGHPLGAAGTRILVTLLHALHARKLKRGLACIAYGGGGAAAMIVETLRA